MTGSEAVDGGAPGPLGVPGTRVLHLAHAADWKASLRWGSYEVSTRGFTLSEVGFIHASTATQLTKVADYVFSGDPEPLVVLVLDVPRLEAAGSPVRWEEGGDGELFPHIHGPAPTDAVMAALPTGFDSVGSFVEPDVTGLDVVVRPPKTARRR